MFNFKVLLLLLILIPFSSGAVNIVDTSNSPINTQTLQGVNILDLREIFDNSTAFVNSSEFWITDIGVAGTVNDTQMNINSFTLTLDEDWLTSFGDGEWLELDGSNANQDINIGAFNFTANKLVADDGDADNAAYSFSGRVDSGMFFSGATGLNFVVAGDPAFTADRFGILVTDGAANAPAYSFSDDFNTGFFRSGEDSVGITLGSVNEYNFTDGLFDAQDNNLTTTGNVDATSFIVQSGGTNLTANKLSFATSVNIQHVAGELRLNSASGIKMLGNTIITGNFEPLLDSFFDLGSSLKAWDNVYGDNFIGDGSQLTGNTSLWERNGTTLIPKNDGDNITTAGALTAGADGTDHELITGGSDAKMVFTKVNAGVDLPEIYGSYSNGGGTGFSIRDGLFIREVGFDPRITFFSSDFSDSAGIDYNTANDELNFSGANNYNFDNNVTTPANVTANQFLAGDGDINNPSYSFKNNPDTGIFQSGSFFSFVVNGVTSAELDAFGLLISDGSSTAPSYTFFDDPDTGFGRAGTNSVRLILGRQESVIYNMTQANFTNLSIITTENITAANFFGNVINYWNETELLNGTLVQNSTLVSNYVPYVGANKAVDLGLNNFTMDNGAQMYIGTALDAQYSTHLWGKTGEAGVAGVSGGGTGGTHRIRGGSGGQTPEPFEPFPGFLILTSPNGGDVLVLSGTGGKAFQNGTAVAFEGIGRGGNFDMTAGFGGFVEVSGALDGTGGVGGGFILLAGRGGGPSGGSTTGDTFGAAGGAFDMTGGGGGPIGSDYGTNNFAGDGGAFNMAGGVGGKLSKTGPSVDGTAGDGGALDLSAGDGGEYDGNGGTGTSGDGGNVSIASGVAGTTDDSAGVDGQIEFLIGTTSVGKFLLDASGLFLPANIKLFLSSASSIYNDGTDLVLNPKETGSGKVRVDGDENVTNNFTGNQIYGEMWLHNHPAVATEINGAMTYENVTGWTFDELNGFSNSTNYTLIPQVAGLYRVTYAISSAGTAAVNDEFSYIIAIDDVVQEKCHSHRNAGTGMNIGSIAGTCLVRLAVDEVVTFQVTNEDSATRDIDISSANVNLMRVGD